MIHLLLIISCTHENKTIHSIINKDWIYYKTYFVSDIEHYKHTDQYFLSFDSKNNTATIYVKTVSNNYSFNCTTKRYNNTVKIFFNSYKDGICPTMPKKGQELFVLKNDSKNLALIEENFSIFATENTDGIAFIPDVNKDFRTFLSNFLDVCYWNKNFFSVLKNNFSILVPYIDSKMGFTRFYTSKTTINAYDKNVHYGLKDIEIDFMKITELTKSANYIVPSPYENPCYSNISKQNEGIYYRRIINLPSKTIINNGGYKKIPTIIPYENAEIMEVLHISANKTLFILYFVKTPKGWKMVASNESDCKDENKF